MAAPRRILWAEDNLGDQLLIRAALDSLPGPAPQVRFAEDGVHFLEALQAVPSGPRGPSSAEAPDLAVLDLRMPRIGGLEALRRVRDDPRWRGLPVAVFSSGNQPEETDACLALGAVQVAHKPVDFRDFTAAVHRLVRLDLPRPA